MLTAPVAEEDQEQDHSEAAPSPATPNGSNPRSKSEMTVAEAIDSYLKDVEPPQREFKTYEEYRNVLYRFRDTCKKERVKDIDRKDCLEFMRHLYSIGNEARTVYNRIGIVQQWLRLNGITGLLQGRDKPSFVTNMWEMYQPEDLEALFQACDPEERIRYLFFLLTGERDKEVRYTAWSDIDFNRRCVRVTPRSSWVSSRRTRRSGRFPCRLPYSMHCGNTRHGRPDSTVTTSSFRPPKDGRTKNWKTS